MAKLTPKQNQRLATHSQHHSKKHMDMMKKLMRQGVSFTEAHRRTQTKVGK